MSDHGYPLARGKMAEVWAKLICPVCDSELEHIDDEYEYDLHKDVYLCKRCKICVCYVSPNIYHEYHQVPDSKRWYEITGY